MVQKGGALHLPYEPWCVQRFWELNDLNAKQLYLRVYIFAYKYTYIWIHIQPNQAGESLFCLLCVFKLWALGCENRLDLIEQNAFNVLVPDF